jgi:signal transduction histidine kinase
MKMDTAGNVKTYQEKENFPAGIVYAFFEDKEGDLWIATEKGLVVYYKGIFKVFNKDSGLLFNEIYQVLEDPSGHVWLSGNLGLQRIALDELLHAKKSGSADRLAVRLFDALDGMPNSETNGGIFPAGWAMNDGTLWFPTGRGVAVADHQIIREESNDLTIHVQSLRYGDREYYPGQEIELHPGVHNFEIHYSSIDFGKSKAIEFYYRLKGLDNNWTFAKNRRVAFFSGLKPGSYSFEVRAERYGKTSTVAVLDFKINPRFYQTTIFKIGIITLLLLAIAGIVFSSRQAARRRLREQQQITRAQISGQEKERQFISTELHDSINQQLSSARIYLDLAREKENMRMDLVIRSEQVIRNAISEINSLCHSLTPPTLRDIGLRDAIEDLVNGYSSIEKFTPHLDFQLDPGKIHEDLQFILYRITQEQVNNIVRHAEAKNVWLEFKSTTAGIHITIKDDGKGFDVKTQKFGMGLQNIKNRLSLYHGRMEIKSSPGKGCTVSLVIPHKVV